MQVSEVCMGCVAADPDGLRVSRWSAVELEDDGVPAASSASRARGSATCSMIIRVTTNAASLSVRGD